MAAEIFSTVLFLRLNCYSKSALFSLEHFFQFKTMTPNIIEGLLMKIVLFIRYFLPKN